MRTLGLNPKVCIYLYRCSGVVLEKKNKQIEKFTLSYSEKAFLD